MKTKGIFFVLAAAFLLPGCTAPASPNSPMSVPSVSPFVSEQPVASVEASVAADAVASALASGLGSATPQTTVQPSAAQPTVASASLVASTTVLASINPYHPDNDVKFELSVLAEDDAGIASVYWESEDDLSVKPDSSVYNCGGVQSCPVAWTFAFPTEGYKTITVYSVNGAGLSSKKTAVQVPVGSSAPPLSIPTPLSKPSVEATSTATPSPSTGADNSCSFNSECGRKQICRDGTCVEVDCTNDAHCGYGKRCSYNSCVRCRSGPYGPAC